MDMSESLSFPRTLFHKSFGLGIDAGTSCFKLAYTSEQDDRILIHFAIFPKDNYVEAFDFIKKISVGKLQDDQDMRLCGTNANALIKDMQVHFNIRPEIRVEVTPMVDAFQFLHKHLPWDEFVLEPSIKACETGANRAKPLDQLWNKIIDGEEGRAYTIFGSTKLTVAPREITYPLLLNQIGTVSLPYVVEQNGNYQICTWNMLAGRTFQALGGYFAETKDYNELLEMLRVGDQSTVHTTIGGLVTQATGAYSQMEECGDAVMANFGELLNKSPSEVNKADLVAAVAESVTTAAARDSLTTARWRGCSQVFYNGSILGSDVIRDKLSAQFVYDHVFQVPDRTIHHYFVRHGSHLGAIGCLLTNLQLV